jgi:hypothetical protein
MLRLENGPMFSRFHTLEQSVERKQDGFGFNRTVSWLYWAASDYGSNALRPVLWFIGLLAFTTIVFCVTDGVDYDGNALVGWQQNFVGDDSHSKLSRAIALSFQSALNPLGIFGKGALTAKFEALALWQFIHGIFSAVFAALFIFAIRRRFKMN